MLDETAASQADAGDSAQNAVLQEVFVFRGGSRFEGKEGLSQAVGETFGERQSGGEGGEIHQGLVETGLASKGQKWFEVGAFQVVYEVAEELREATGSDLLENWGLGELG